MYTPFNPAAMFLRINSLEIKAPVHEVSYTYTFIPIPEALLLMIKTIKT
jgi:hypothetical protein